MQEIVTKLPEYLSALTREHAMTARIKDLLAAAGGVEVETEDLPVLVLFDGIVGSTFRITIEETDHLG